MGLDMYLTTRNKETKEVVNDELYYWRKANQIRKWFVNNTGYNPEADCEYHPITIEQLKALRNDCVEVTDNHEKAYTILPTSSGFFFGSENYDEWYYEQVENTADFLNDFIKEFETNKEEYQNIEICYYEWW